MEFLTKSKWYLLVFAVCMVAVGLCMILWPGVMTELVCYVFGGTLIVFGLAKVFSFFIKRKKGLDGFKYDFAIGLFLMLCGLTFVLTPESILGILQTVVGFALFADAAVKLQVSFDAYRTGASNWWIMLILSLVTVAMGLLCVLYDVAQVVTVLIGVSVLVDGLQNIGTVLYISKMFKIDRATEVVYYKTGLED